MQHGHFSPIRVYHEPCPKDSQLDSINLNAVVCDVIHLLIIAFFVLAATGLLFQICLSIALLQICFSRLVIYTDFALLMQKQTIINLGLVNIQSADHENWLHIGICEVEVILSSA